MECLRFGAACNAVKMAASSYKDSLNQLNTQEEQEVYERRNLRFLLLASIFFVMAVSSISAAGNIIYVKEDGTGGGTSWGDGYGDIQEALETASSGDEIWVSTGTYYPSAEIGGSGDRYKAFQLINGVGIYGGFAGTETSLAERDVENNVTILSGDIGVAGVISDNCYHVFYHPDGTDLDASAILSGFIITAGNADGSGVHDYGGGMCNYSSSPTVTGCAFTSNSGR